MTQLIKNAARAALAAGIAAADTSLTVDITKADLFPAANTGTDPVNTVGKDWFKIVVEDASHNYEIMYVRTRTLGSAVMSNLLRGQEGTTAISFSAGSVVGLRITANDIENALSLSASASTFGKSLLSAVSAAASRILLGVLSSAQIQSQENKTFTTGGTSTAFTLTTDGALTALTVGEEYDVVLHTDAGTNPTLNRDGLGPKSLKYRDANGVKRPITSLQGPSGWRTKMVYDGTDYIVRETPPVSYQIGPNFTNASTMVAQRGTAGTLSTTPVVGQCDNIGMWASAGAVSAGTIAQITTAISGASGYAARAAGVTLTGSAVLSQSIRMESRDALKYKNQTASFQVKVDHDVGSAVNYTLVVKKPTVADNFGTRTTIATSSATSVASATGTTLKFEGVALGDCSNGLELEIQAACGAVTTKNFNVTEFQVEINPTATTWNGRSIAEETEACQRLLPSWSASANNAPVPMQCGGASATAATGAFSFKTSTRIAPTALTNSPGSQFSVLRPSTGSTLCTSLTFAVASTEGATVQFNAAAGLVNDAHYIPFANSATRTEMLFTGAELF